MSDEPHTIPDHVVTRISRLINEAEDMRQQAVDDLKQIYADLRAELRGMGWAGSVVSAEVAALKGAIVEMRLDDEKKAKREEKGERIGDYISMLSRARAREGQSYAEAKGRDDVDAKLIETVVKGVQTEIGRNALVTALDVMIAADETGELTDNQEQPETATKQRANVQPQHEVTDCTGAGIAFGGQATVRNVGVTAGETAPHSHSPATPSQAQQADTTSEAVTPPAVSLVGPFNNPRCQHPDTCHLAHSRDECFDCSLAWSKRPKDEQVLLWAEAMEAARESEVA